MKKIEGFLTGILSIAVLTSLLFLLLPNDTEENIIPIVKLAVGIWIVRSVFSLFGHSFL